jgi:hypothetical protein
MIWDEVRRTRNRLLPVAAVALAGFVAVAWFVFRFRKVEPFGLLCCASPLLAFLGLAVLLTLFMALHPAGHQLVTLLASYGPPREVADRIDAELRDPERAVVFGGPRPLLQFWRSTWPPHVGVTANWVIGLAPNDYFVIPLPLVGWVYKQYTAGTQPVFPRLRYSVGCQLLTGTGRLVHLNDEEEADEMLRVLLEHRPELLTGFRPERLELAESDPAALREEYARRLAAVRGQSPAERRAWLAERWQELQTWVRRVDPAQEPTAGGRRG